MAEEEEVPVTETPARAEPPIPPGEQSADAAKKKPPRSSERGERPAVVEIDLIDEEPGGPIVSRRDLNATDS